VSAPPRYGALLVAIAAIVTAPFLAVAQGDPAPGPPAPPASVPLAEVGGRSDAVKQAVARRVAQAASLQNVEPIDAGLDAVRAAVAAQELALGERLPRITALDSLIDLDAEWVRSDGELGTLRAELRRRAEALAEQLAQLDEIGALWAATREDAVAAEAPRAVLTQIREVQAATRAATSELTRGRDRVLEAQSAAAGLAQSISAARARIAETQTELLANIFVRDAPPLWGITAAGETGGAALERLRAELESQATATRQLASEQRERGVLHVLGTVALMLLLIAARRRTREWPKDDPKLCEIAAILEHPCAIALLAGIAATSSIYQQPPRAVRELADLLLLMPALVLISPLLERALRPALALLAGFYVLDQIRDVVDPLPVVSRLLFTLEMLLVVGASGWLLQRATRSGAWRQGAIAAAELPETALPRERPLARAAERVIPGLIQIVMGVCGIAAACSVLGFQRLARLLGDAVLESAYIGLVIYALAHATRALVAFVLRSRHARAIHTLGDNAERLADTIGRGLKVIAAIGWGAIVLQLFGVREMALAAIGTVLGAELGVGSVAFSLGDVLMFAFTVAVALGLARGVEVVLEADVYPRLGTPRGSAYAFSTILRYAVLLVGFMASMSALGLDTDRLTVLLGAFGVGLGFGLQTIVNSFVSGLILLFERPIQVGDAIEVEGVAGTVRHIGIRASIVRTFDGSDVSVPNGNLLSSLLVNWTMSDRHRRIEIPVGVAYGTDPDRVLELLRDIAAKHASILPAPPPQPLFRGFGESSLDFSLRAWVADNDYFLSVRSELVHAIYRALEEARIEIPFPQRDLHIRALPPAPASAHTGPLGETHPLTREPRSA
jgi:small-conductance mechanosensitive channel